MRKLRTSDLFSFARVIKTSGIREELVGYIQELSVQENIDQSRVGINTIFMIIEALADKKAEGAIYDALAPVFEMTADDVAAMSPSDLIGCLKQLAEENDLVNFMDSVSGILGKN